MSAKVQHIVLEKNYNLAIVACGYETRSRFMVSSLDINAHVKIALGYAENEEIAFDDNVVFFNQKGFSVDRVSDNIFDESLSRIADSLPKASDQRVKVLIDISCFTRYRLACVIRAFSSMNNVDVDFFYSIAAYEPPPPDDIVSEHVGPASEYFSGWSGEYTNPSVVISGLGYEHMKALGVIELLDPSGTWLFFPISPIGEYDLAVRNANDLLLRDIDPARVIEYSVTDAPSLVRDLFSLVSHLRERNRCVLIPLGPKIFAFCAMLAGAHFRDISVWRVSAGKYAKPVDRKPSGLHTLFRVSFDGENV